MVRCREQRSGVGVDDRDDDTDDAGEEMGKLGIVESAPEVV